MNELININSQDGTLTVSSREVAANFGKRPNDVVRAIESKVENLTVQKFVVEKYFIESSFEHNGNVYKEYLLTRDGFSFIVMGFTGREADEWKLKYIEAFNKMEFQIKTSFSELSPQLQLLIGIEQKQREHDKAFADTNARIDGISEIVALNTNSWRSDAKHLISKIALQMGGYDYIREVQSEIYKLLDSRFAVSLETRLTNKRRRMADEGVCKSRRDKLSKVDIIAEDKKLIEGYITIIKEIAVKQGVANAKEA